MAGKAVDQGGFEWDMGPRRDTWKSHCSKNNVYGI